MGFLSTVIGFFRRARADLDGNRKKPIKSKPRAKIKKRLLYPAAPPMPTIDVVVTRRGDLRHDRYLGRAQIERRRKQWAEDRPDTPYPFDKPNYWGP